MIKGLSLPLLCIILLGFFLRVVLLDKYPPSLNWDEVSHGYNAYSILKTGHDEWGNVLPFINFRAYGDYPLPLNLYLTIPFIFIFGLTEFAIRFPHAILGTLTLFSVYFLTFGITKDKRLGLLSSLLACFTPWYLFTSRFVLQSNLSIFLLISSMALFFNREKNRTFLPISFVFLGLTLFSYHSTRIFTPLLIIPLVGFYHKEIRKSVASIIIIVVFFISLSFIFFSSESRARSSFVFLINEGSVNSIIEQRKTSNLPVQIKRLAYNRPVYFLTQFTKNYIDYFSPRFLFLEGGTQYQFSIPHNGLLYFVNLPFFYLGLYFVLRKVFKKQKPYLFLFIWLLLAPIPASITTERFAVLRSSAMLPLTEIFTAIGLVATIDWLKSKKINVILPSFVYLLVLAVLCEGYLINYFTNYSEYYSWSWQYGYRQAVDYAKENYKTYDKIIFTKKYGEPHEYVLFYNQWDPQKFINDQNLVRFNQSNWWWVDKFDKYYFVNDWAIKDMKLESGEIIDCSISKCLLISSPGNYPKDWEKLEQINFVDGKPAFEIYEN